MSTHQLPLMENGRINVVQHCVSHDLDVCLVLVRHLASYRQESMYSALETGIGDCHRVAWLSSTACLQRQHTDLADGSTGQGVWLRFPCREALLRSSASFKRQEHSLKVGRIPHPLGLDHRRLDCGRHEGLTGMPLILNDVGYFETRGLVAQGASNQQIATALAISQATVRKHVSSILSKLHLASRTQAREEGLTASDEAGSAA